MGYFLEDFKEHLTRDIAKLLSIDPGLIMPEKANEKIGADIAIPCFVLAKEKGENPHELAKQITSSLELSEIDKIETAGGFVNIWLKPQAMAEGVFKTQKAQLDQGKKYGDVKTNQGEIVVTEYTDPNPFKEFHIGHAYSNTVGESFSRLYEASGAEVHRVSYHGDVGIHVAKTLWAAMKELDKGELKIEDIPKKDRVKFLGQAYVHGNKSFDENEQAKAEITELNKVIYDKSDKNVNHIYEVGRKWSFDYFDEVYERLNVGFEKKYLESETVETALALVKKGLKDRVFDESDGAVVFRGENFGLHTRVFINSKGLPTYEAKDLGLASLKHADYRYTQSVILTANEQDSYFRVVLKAMDIMNPKLAEATLQMSHGMVRLPSGKMGSRTGNVITAVSILDDIESALKKSNPDSPSIKENTLGALKYSFLKHTIGSDIVFDIDESISLEGNSGPYLQYSAVRISSILDKIGDDIGAENINYDFETERELLLMAAMYPEVISESVLELEPHSVANYLYDLARTWNRYYEKVNISDSDEESKASRVKLIKLIYSIFEHGLNILGIEIPEKM